MKKLRLITIISTRSEIIRLSAISAKRLRIPFFHMEAGNCCFDEKLPEETNRCIVDRTKRILSLRERTPAEQMEEISQV